MDDLWSGVDFEALSQIVDSQEKQINDGSTGPVASKKKRKKHHRRTREAVVRRRGDGHSKETAQVGIEDMVRREVQKCISPLKADVMRDVKTTVRNVERSANVKVSKAQRAAKKQKVKHQTWFKSQKAHLKKKDVKVAQCRQGLRVAAGSDPDLERNRVVGRMISQVARKQVKTAKFKDSNSSEGSRYHQQRNQKSSKVAK